MISVGRIAGTDNVEAGFESRNINIDINIDMEWRLDPDLLAAARERLKEHPCTDLFTSRLSHQFPKFASYRPDPDAFDIDIFNII